MAYFDTRTYLKYRASVGRSRMSVIFNALAESCILDEVNIHAVNEHDKIFIPQNEFEKDFWERSRKKTKQENLKLYHQIKGGKLGGRPKKRIDTEEAK